MSLSFCSLSSGSSGNCYIIKSERTALLVDAGISGKKILEGLAALGTAPEEIMGILVTHEHIDHVKSVKVLTKKLPYVNVYASRGTWECINDKVDIEKQRVVFAGREFVLGDITVRPFALSHDAVEPVGYAFEQGGKQISIVTDTGIVTEEIHSVIKCADLLVIEANHDVHTIQFCNYPYTVKRRIMGNFGHLSNDAAAEEICRICNEDDKYREVVLAHLSKETNFPEMAYQTIKNSIEEKNIYIGRNIELDIIVRDSISPVFTLE